MRLAIPLVLLLLAAIAGCTPVTTTGGRVGTTHAPRAEAPIELSLRTTDGRIVELSDQQGAPVLLVLFATYDGGSLAVHREITRFARERLDTVVLAVAVQPDARTFATAFVESQSPPYTVVYEERDSILRGVSDLGEIEAIPMLIMIDAYGHECARQVGYAGGRVIDSMREVALSRGGVRISVEEAEEAARAAETEARQAESQPAPAEAPPEAPPPDEGGPQDGEVVIEP